MLTDVWQAIQWYWWAICIGLAVTLVFERLHPFYKVLFWTCSVALVAYLAIRVGIGGIMNAVDYVVDSITEGISK